MHCLSCHFLFSVKIFMNKNVYWICEFFKVEKKIGLWAILWCKWICYFIKKVLGVPIYFCTLNIHVYISVNKSTDKRENKEKIKACIFNTNSEMFCAHKVTQLMNFLKNFWLVSAEAGQQWSLSDWQLEHSNSDCYNTNITLNLSQIDVVSFPLLAFSSHKEQPG